MLSNLYPALLHKMETTQDAILDAMDRLEIWLDSFTVSPSTSTSMGKAGSKTGSKCRRTSEVVFDSSDDSDEDGER